MATGQGIPNAERHSGELQSLMLGLAEIYGLHKEVADLLKDKPIPPPATACLADLLKAARLARGATLVDVANRCGISRSQLSFYESGRQKNAGLRTIQALSYGYRIAFPLLITACLREANLLGAPGAPVIAPVRKRKRTGVR